MKVAFDIDKTLWLVDNERGKNFPNHELVNVLKWFHKNGDEVFVWSTGGEDYAKEIVEKIGIADLVSIITKTNYNLNDALELFHVLISYIHIEIVSSSLSTLFPSR